MNKQAFRRGMLSALAAKGITPEDLGRYAMRKAAGAEPLTKAAKIFGTYDVSQLPSTALNLAKDIGINIPFLVPAGLGAVGGALGGYTMAKLNRPDYEKQIAATQDDEVVKELKQQIMQVKSRMSRRGHRSVLTV